MRKTLFLLILCLLLVPFTLVSAETFIDDFNDNYLNPEHWIMWDDPAIHIPPHPVQVVDVTGAGDAFWAGLLTAYLDNLSLIQAARAGQILAEMKIQSFGPLQKNIDFEMVKQQAQEKPYTII